MAVETKRAAPARLQGKVGPGDAIWVASPEEEEGKAAHLVSWQGQMAEVRLADDPENVQSVPRDWVCSRRPKEPAPAAEPKRDGRGADTATVARCADPFDAVKRAIPLVIKRLQKEIDEAAAEVHKKESELREARRHRATLMERRRYEIGRLKVALKVLARPRKTAQSGKRR